jgi:hypothetical protein
VTEASAQHGAPAAPHPARRPLRVARIAAKVAVPGPVVLLLFAAGVTCIGESCEARDVRLVRTGIVVAAAGAVIAAICARAALRAMYRGETASVRRWMAVAMAAFAVGIAFAVVAADTTAIVVDSADPLPPMFDTTGFDFDIGESMTAGLAVMSLLFYAACAAVSVIASVVALRRLGTQENSLQLCP